MREMLARSDHDFVLEERKPRRGAAKRGRRLSAAFGTLFRNPGRTIVGATAAAVGVGILVNALALQGAPHPAPLFKPAPPARPAAAAPAQPARPAATPQATSPAPSAPAAGTTAASEAAIPLPPRIQRAPAASASAAEPAPRTAASAPVPPAPIPVAPRDAISDILRGGAPAPTAIAAEPERAVLAAQRALNKLNYGPVKPDGLMGPGTRQAIERFERDRKLPLTGEPTGRTARELTAASGIAVD